MRLRQLGKRLGLSKVHPHKFTRTLATMAIDKEMPIEQLQQLLGHRRIDTTLQYTIVKQSNEKLLIENTLVKVVGMEKGYKILGNYIRLVDSVIRI